MKFGRYPTKDCKGWILAHSVRTNGSVITKGRVLGSGEIAALLEAGIEEIMAAKLEDGDIDEASAAVRIARTIAGQGLVAEKPSHGRVNIRAGRPGLLVQDPVFNQINALDEGISVASLPSGTVVQRDQLVATVKIIPFSLGQDLVQAAEALVTDPELPRALYNLPFQACRPALIQTELPGTEPKLLDKTRRTIDSRLQRLGGRLQGNAVVPHHEKALAEIIATLANQGHSPILIMGASATLDRRDVVPTAITMANGVVTRFGLPVDPGNLLLIGHRNGSTIIGLPGCARSPARNGVDWVLERVMAGLGISDEEIAEFGARGLLKESVERSQPREGRREKDHKPTIAAVVLAAGLSRRMGENNKLLAATADGPLIRKTVQAIAGTGVRDILVVLGHQAEAVRKALEGESVQFVYNADFEQGMGTSIAAGIAALPEQVDAAFVVLGDMPLVRPDTIAKLTESLGGVGGVTAVAPCHRGKRGNPVLWGRQHFPLLKSLSGDRGARSLLGELGDTLALIEVDDPGVLFDVDTKDALQDIEK